MNPIILFRDINDYPGELEEAQKWFDVVTNRAKIPHNSLVIGRYSVLPFYKELEEDVLDLGSKLINSYMQHRYIADLGNYAHHLKGLTPKTWNHLDQIPFEGPFIVKGETNSKKFEWNKKMFAKNKDEAVRIYCDLQNDGLICDQTIYIREYVPLRTFMIGIGGIPIAEEYRFFVYKDTILCGGYYWSNHIEEIKYSLDPFSVPREFLREVMDCVGKNCNFYVIDVARKEDGNWIVVELNDGCMSGLSDNNPIELYSNLADALEKEKS